MIQNHKINFKTIFIKKNTHKNRKFIIFEKKNKGYPSEYFSAHKPLQPHRRTRDKHNKSNFVTIPNFYLRFYLHHPDFFFIKSFKRR